MGYFSNGTEGDIFDAKWCQRCIHRPDEEQDCPVLFLHAVWNYDQCGEGEVAGVKRDALDALIVRSEDGLGNDCKMFVPRNGCLSPNSPPPPLREAELAWVQEHPEAVLRYVQERRELMEMVTDRREQIRYLQQQVVRLVEENDALREERDG